MAHDYVQIPPDSTGKKIRHTERLDMEINTILVDLAALERGNPIVGLTSGATAKFLSFKIELGETYIYGKPVTGTFTVGEVITVNGINTATIDNFAIQQTSNVILSDFDTPHNRLQIDKEGSAYVRYSEGDLGFDAFGHAQFTQATKVDDFVFTYGDHTDEFYDDIVLGASITSSISDSSIVLSTPITSGSRITRTSHQYFPYNPGEGNELLLSYRCGDEGTANVIRRWGLFDDEDGLFFELSGSEFSVGIRNSSSGIPVDIKVVQADMNGDSLDAPNISNYILEFSKYNIYWIDYQWLGVGKVRFGTFAPDGTRVTIHTFNNPNQFTSPYMRRGTLPLRIEQFNIDTSATTTESRIVCGAIMRQSGNLQFPGHYYSYSAPTTAISSSIYTPIVSTKPQITHLGEINRATLIPTDFEIYVDGDPIEIDIIVNPGLTGSTFAESASIDSVFLIDDTSTSFVGGTRKDAIIAGSGVTHREIVEDLNNTLKLSADGVSQPIFCLAAKCMKSGGNANVKVLFRWKETR